MFISAVPVSLKASYRKPDSGVVVKEGLFRQNVWIIETWKEGKEVELNAFTQCLKFHTLLTQLK